PASAPELHPVEFIWGDCTHHELPDFCPKDFAHLNQVARSRLRSMPRRPKLVAAFGPQAALPL
ncbi:MAG: IS630 family transposase, partial [Nitrospiraceae bacterium]